MQVAGKAVAAAEGGRQCSAVRRHQGAAPVDEGGWIGCGGELMLDLVAWSGR